VVVEDAAPAIGESYRGRKVGSNAQQTVFSFHPRKVITTGEGGMITTDDDLLADRARKLRAHGMSVSDLERHRSDHVIIEEYNELGFNYRMTDIQASIGLVQLRRLDELLRVRRAKAKRYNDELSEIRGIAVPFVPPYAEHTYQSYCLRLTKDCRKGREELMTNLLRRGIATRRGVMASHLEKTYTTRYGTVSLPVTEEATRTTMLIPLYASMTDDEQTYVIDALREELGPV
jgi:perosamine synthetase